MFSLVAGSKGKERIYSILDRVEFALLGSYRFSGELVNVDEKGYVYFKHLSILKEGKYEQFSGSLKVHCSEINECRLGYKQEKFTLIDDNMVGYFLVAKKAKVVFGINNVVCLEVKTSRGKVLYTGTLKGFQDSKTIVMMNVVAKEYLKELGIYSESSRSELCKVPIDKVEYAWKPDNKNMKYRVRLLKKII